MLIRFAEQEILNFSIPSFTLSNGEIVVIDLFGGALFRPLVTEIAGMLTGTVNNNHIEVLSPLYFVPRLKDPNLISRFFPLTIKGYHNKYANKSNPVYKKIFEHPDVTPKTKVKTLNGTLQKLLSLYTTLTWSNNIVFDLTGVDPDGGVYIYNYLKTVVSSGGAAVLLDTCDEFQFDCTTFIKAQYLGEFK